MVLKIQVEFSTPISIQGNAKNSMFILLEPYLQGETSSDIPDFANDQDAANNGFKASTTHLGQTLTNVFETNPTNVEVIGKKLKLTLNSYFDDIYQYLKTFHFFYEEKEENGKILRGDVAASLSQSTKVAVSNSSGLVETTGATAPLEAKDEFEFKIEKILIKDEEPDKIFYFYTSNRTLKIENNADGQAINAVDGTFAVNVGNFLSQTFTNADEYFDTALGTATEFDFDNTAGVTIGENTEGKFFSVQRDTTTSRLTKNSGFSTASIQTGTYNTTDEFGFPLKIDLTTHTEVDNKIKNPTLHAEIIPSTGGEGYIAIKMSKDEGTTFLNMVGVTKDNSGNITNDDSDRTIRHGGGDDDQTDHPVTGDLIVTSGNAFNANDLDFNFTDDNGYQKIQDIILGNELKIDENNPDVILMRLNRFPRHGITYSINYSHQLNLASGIFGPNNNGVLTQNPINVSNDLKEVTAIVGKLKVHYPSSKPSWADKPNSASVDFDAYYYVDVTFQRGGQDVDITAKYDINKPSTETAFGYQADSGHKIHHGLIISKGNNAIFEDITRTTIRDQNGDPVTLGENSFGKFLRIEVPFAVGNPETGTAGAYPYDITLNNNEGGITTYNFADVDSNSPPGILLSDRQEKDVGGNVIAGEFYYINVMDSQGNVVKPFTESNLQTDTDWGKDKDENTPSVASIEYKVRWNGAAWVKELVLTHHQDLQGAGVVSSLALTNDGTSMGPGILVTVVLDNNDGSILNVGIAAGDDTLLTGDVTNGKIKLAYTKPGTANNLTNWAGFEIDAYSGSDAKTVTLDASNPALPSFSNLATGIITSSVGSFSVPLTWNQTGNDNGITYEVEVSTDGGTNYNPATISAGPTNTGATISGLSYGQAYTFRVRATTYEDGPYSSSVSLLAQTAPSGPTPSSFVANLDVDGNIETSWDLPSSPNGEVWDYKLEVSTSNSFGQNDIVVEKTGGAASAGSETEANPFTSSAGAIVYEVDIDDLDGNTKYYLRVSIRENDNGSYGQYGAFENREVVTLPPKVTGLSSSNETDSTLTLGWTAIGGQSFGSNEGYTVQQSTDNANWTTLNNTTPTTNTTYGVTNLTANTSYYFRVRATNASGSGEWSDSYSVSTTAPSDTSPPSFTAGDWEKSVDNSSWTTVNNSNPEKIKAGEYIRFNFTSTDAEGNGVALSGNATLSAGGSSVVTTNSLTGPDSNGDCSIQFQIPSNSTQNGTLQVEFTLTDTESNTQSVNETNSDFTLDTTKPTISGGEVGESGSILTLTFSEEMYLGSTGSIDGFTFTVDGTTTTPSTTSPPEIIADDRTLIDFTFDDTIYNDDTVTVAYTQPTTAANKLRDEAGNLLANFGTSEITVVVTSAPTEDTTAPNTSNFTWQFKRGTAAYQNLSSEISLKSGDKLKVSFDATDDTGCQVATSPAPAVTVGTGSTNGTITTPISVTGNVTDGFIVTMEYEIANGDNGDISFSLTLTDGSSSTSVNASPSVGGNAVTVTADTTAPTNTGNTGIGSSGTTLSLTFDEEIQVGSGGTVANGFTLTVNSNTVTGYSVAINNTDNKIINFTSIPTVYQNDSVSLSYTPPGSTGDVDRITDAAGNEVTAFTPSINNGSSQQSGPPPDNSPPSLSGFNWYYQESGSTTWTSITQSETLGLSDKVKLEFTATDATGCIVSSNPPPAVTIGGYSGSSSNINTNVTTSSPFTVTMEYEIATGDNGAISFAMTLTDGTNSVSLTTSEGTPPSTMTADTTAPAISGTPTWQVWTSSNPSAAKTGTMSHIAVPGEKIRLYFDTTTTDLSGATVTGIEFNDNGDDTNNNSQSQGGLAVNVQSGSTTGHYIEYQVNGSSNDMGFPRFKFKLEDTTGNESTLQDEYVVNPTLASDVQARQYQQPSDNNTEFQVTLIDVPSYIQTQNYGEVQFDLSYNVTSDFYLPYDINKIVFNADKDISYNGQETFPWNKWFIDTGVNNNYTMTDDGSQYSQSVNNLFDSNGHYSIKSTEFNDAHPKKHDGASVNEPYPGIGGGDKFIEVKLHFNYEDGSSGNYRRIFEQKDSNGNLTGTAFTMQDNSTTKAYTSVRSKGAARGVNRYNNNSVNADDNWANKEDDPYLLALHNFSQKTNANNEPIKNFKLDADYSTVSAKYKFPTYLWGSVVKGKLDDGSNGWTQCEAWNGAGSGGVGDWPVRRYDVSKNILEYDIKGYYIKAQKNTDQTVLTYNNGLSGNSKHLIDVDDITSYSNTAKLYNDDPYVDSAKQYPEMINYIHRFKMDEMNGTSDNLVKYGISGEKIDWQITPVNELDYDKINLPTDGTDYLEWNSASEYAAHGYNVKQGYIPRLPFNDTNLQNPEIINKSGGTNKSSTADHFVSTYDSSGNFDVSFNYWEEGKQLYFPSDNYDHSYNSIGAIPESKSYFVNKFKFHTDISGATPGFDSSITLDMRMMSVDTGIPVLGAYNVLYIHNDTSDIPTNNSPAGTNGFISSSLPGGVNNVSQYPNKLEVYEGITYIFDVSDPTNSAYEINFSTSAPSSVNTSYTSIGSSSITRNGDPGTSGATVTIVAPSSTMYIYDSSNNGLSTPADGFGGPLMDQLFISSSNEEESSGGSFGWTNSGSFSDPTSGTYGISSIEPVGDYRIKDISWNETYNGIMGNGDTNDISFNVTDLSNNRYYKYYYTITNTLCKTDASGVTFPETGYNSILTNPANPTAIFNNFENYTNNTETDVDVNAPNAYPAIPLGILSVLPGGGLGGLASTPLGIGYGTDVENMLFNVEWQYKDRTYAPSSLQRVALGHSSNTVLQNMNDAEAFGYSISMSGDGKTIAVGAPYYDGRLNDNTGNEVSSTTKMGRVVVYKWRNSRWEMDSFSSGETNSDDSSFGSDEYRHGFSLSLNNNGNVLIIGAPGKHGSNTTRGRARVYLYNEIRNVWDETFNTNSVVPVDPTLADSVTPYKAFDDYYVFGSQQYTEIGGSVAVSADGKTIIAGGRTYQATISSTPLVSFRSGHIQVARWSDEYQRYQDKISIFFDGYNPTENAAVQNYPYEGNQVRAYGGTNGASAEFGFSVAVSGDGRLFSAGTPYWSGDKDYNNDATMQGSFTIAGNGNDTGKVALFYRAPSNFLPENSLKTMISNGASSFVNVLQGNAFADLSEDSNGRYELNKSGFNNTITDMSDNEFGYSMCFNNGNRLAVSAPGEDHSNYDYKGSVYIYDCSGTAIGGLGSENVNLICKIKNHDTSNDDEYFGAGLSLSGNGNYVAIGKPYQNIGSKTDSGIVQVFKIPEPETITHVVTVQSVPGSGNRYFIDGTQTPDLDFVVGNTYIFDLSDSSNAGGGGHPLYFSTTQNGIHASPGGLQFTTGVTDTYGGGIAPGTSGANITITIQPYSPKLYYYCGNHSGMGGNSTSKIFLRTATQVGGDISGNEFAEFNTADTMRDDKALFGYSVDLNETGDVLCVGATQYPYSQSHPPVDVSGNGYAMVFKYDSVNDKWVNVSGKYTDGSSYTTKSQSSLYDGSRNVVVSSGKLNFTLIESSTDVEDSDALMPFSRGRCPDYGSNIVVKSANRKDNIDDWNYSPETTIIVGDFEESDFEVDKLYFNRYSDAGTSPLTLRLSFKNKLGRIYATGPDPQDNNYNSGSGTPVPTLTMFNQFTFDISYNKGSIDIPDWVDVSSNVNLNHWTTNGHVGSSVDTGDGLIYNIVGANANEAGSGWIIKPWEDGEGQGDSSVENGDVELYFDDQAIKYTENSNTTYWTHANSWRWNIRVSYTKGSSGNDKIVSQFNRYTNGEYDGDTNTFEIELEEFTQQSVEIPLPIPNSLIQTTLTPQIIIKDNYLTVSGGAPVLYESGDKIPYGSEIEIEVRFPREVFADSHLGNFDNSFFNYLGDSSTGGSIFDSQGQNDTWNGVVEALVPANDDACGWRIKATVSNKWTINKDTQSDNNSEDPGPPAFYPDEEIQLLANYINDKYGNPNIASSWFGWQVDFQYAFDSQATNTGESGYYGGSSYWTDQVGSGSIGELNVSGIAANDWASSNGDYIQIKFYGEQNMYYSIDDMNASDHFEVTGNSNVTINTGLSTGWDNDGADYWYLLAVNVDVNEDGSGGDATIKVKDSPNGTYPGSSNTASQYVIQFS